MIDCNEFQRNNHLHHHHQQQQQQQNHSSQEMTANLVDIEDSTSKCNRLQPSGQIATTTAASTATSQSIHITNSNNTSNNNNTNSELIGYYFGSISRETTEWILKNHGNQTDGAYLLRSSGPNDDFVLSLLVNHDLNSAANNNCNQTIAGGDSQLITSASCTSNNNNSSSNILEVLHYKIVETEDSFVALHGQVGDEKFATIDELIDKAQGVATKPRRPILRQTLESQILPPTYWGLTVDQVRLAILIKAKQWGFPLLSSLFQNNQQCQPVEVTGSQPLQQQQQLDGGVSSNVTTLNNETIRTLIYKSLHEFQPWFHGKISREEAERRIEEAPPRDGRFLVRERDNYSYAMCINHKRTTKHYRIDVLPTGELAIQDGRKFTSLMALVSHYTIMSDGLWCALTEACPRPIQVVAGLPSLSASGMGNNASNLLLQQQQQQQHLRQNTFYQQGNGQLGNQNNNIYCVPPGALNDFNGLGNSQLPSLPCPQTTAPPPPPPLCAGMNPNANRLNTTTAANDSLHDSNQGAVVASLKAPIKEWLQTINHKWTQLMATKNHQSLNSFLFGSQNPLNNHCRHHNRSHRHHHHHHQRNQHNRGGSNGGSVSSQRKCRNGHNSCGSCNGVLTTNSQQPTTGTGGFGSGIRPQAASSLRSMRNGCHSIGRETVSNGRFELGRRMTTLPSTVTGNDMIIPANNWCPQTVAQQQQQMTMQKNSTISTQPFHQATAKNNMDVLLESLPQNSGFSLNSQSFIGSPLFAVRASAHQTTATSIASLHHQNSSSFSFEGNNLNLKSSISTIPNGARNGSGGSSGGSGNSSSGGGGYNVGNASAVEEKLISPAQSISANLNADNNHTNGNGNNYNQSCTDIYGSQTSTAIVNDNQLQVLTSSGSSSSGVPRSVNTFYGAKPNQQNKQQQHQQVVVANSRNGQVQYGASGAAVAELVTAQINQNNLSMAGQQQTRPPVKRAGPILCGQHAGPAYRYTNCHQDENLFTSCAHQHPHPAATLPTNARLPVTGGGGGSGGQFNANTRQQARYGMAADDSHLLSSGLSSQLVGPAAMAKFVQFQDGQCLRTHRDTRSIQMAYLSSKLQQQQQQQQQLAPRSLAANDQAVTLNKSLSGQLHHNRNNATQGQPQQQHRHQLTPLTSTYQQQAMANTLLSGACVTTGGKWRDPNFSQQQQQQAQNHHRNPLAAVNGQQQQHSHIQGDFTSGNRMNTLPNSNFPSSLIQPQPQQQQTDHIGDLMDCGRGPLDDIDVDDDDGFEFKYDPKLIKSSSIETLCGIATGNTNGHSERAETIEDLSNFKSNRELVMSLQPYWFSAPESNHQDYNIQQQQQQQQQFDDILCPIPANYLGTETRNGAPDVMNNAQSLASLLQLGGAGLGGCVTNACGNGTVSSNSMAALSKNNNNNATVGGNLQNAQQQDDQLNSMEKKHDLDELTTAMLAELTASLKAQVDLKNKRCGFGLPNSGKQQYSLEQSSKDNNNNHNNHGNSNLTAAQQVIQRNHHQQQQQHQMNHHSSSAGGGGQCDNPTRELIDEFDTLIPHNNNNYNNRNNNNR